MSFIRLPEQFSGAYAFLVQLPDGGWGFFTSPLSQDEQAEYFRLRALEDARHTQPSSDVPPPADQATATLEAPLVDKIH